MRAASLPNEPLNGRIQISSKPVEGCKPFYNQLGYDTSIIGIALLLRGQNDSIF
jgi:hypothetical protein